MPASARCGVTRRCVLPLGCTLLLCGCALPGVTTATATPSATPAAVSPSPTAPAVSSVRTVLAQLGLNIHAQPATTAPVLGVAAQGTTLTVLAQQQSGGGWLQVQGQTVTGWIVADPALTAPGLFTMFNSQQLAFSALYPQNWTFAVAGTSVEFRPQQGTQTILVRTAPSLSSFSGAPPGYLSSFSQQDVVCGYTGTLVEYELASGSATPSPPAAGITSQPLLADIRLTFDASHAMDLTFEYSSAPDLSVFQDLYNSLVVPYPLCEQ